MNLENMPNESSQSQKNPCYRIHMKCPEQADPEELAVGWGGGVWLLRGTGFPLSHEDVLKLTVVTAAQPCQYTENHWGVHFKWVNHLAWESYTNCFFKASRRHCVPTIPLYSYKLHLMHLIGQQWPWGPAGKNNLLPAWPQKNWKNSSQIAS